MSGSVARGEPVALAKVLRHSQRLSEVYKSKRDEDGELAGRTRDRTHRWPDHFSRLGAADPELATIVAWRPAALYETIRRYVMGRVINLYGGRDPRELPSYSIGEGAVYLGIPPSTLRTWIHGQHVKRKTLMRSLITLDASDPSQGDERIGMLSFNNIAEAYVLASLTRKFKLPLQRVRAALSFVGTPRPLLTTVFRTDGRGIFVENMGALVDAAHGGQAAFREVIESSLQRVDLDNRSLPLRLYPWRREPTEPRIIALDPRRSFGRPTVAGSAVQMDVIIDRHQAGESISELAAEYGLEHRIVEGVLRWGYDVAKAA